MSRPHTGINRRSFMKSVCATTAAAAGAAALAGGDAAAAVAKMPPSAAWGAAWRPETPQRLSDTVRHLAKVALSGEHGRALSYDTPHLTAEETAALTRNQAYALAARRAAETAPLRILPGERIVGSATLFEGAAHAVPFLGVSSTSHTTLGWHKVLPMGYRGLRAKIEERLSRGFPEDERAVPGPEPAELPDVVCAGVHGTAFRASAAGAYWHETASTPALCGAPLRVECRARLESSDRFNVLVLHKNKDSRHHWEIYSYAGSGEFSAYLPGYTPDEIKSGHVITDGKWHDLAMEFTGERVRLFVDGSLVKDAPVASNGRLGDGAGGLYIGGYPYGPIGCDGLIERVRVSNDSGVLVDWTVESPDFRLNTARVRYATPVNKGRDLLESMLACLDAAQVWHARYLAELDARIARSTGPERATCEEVRAVLARVPENPPGTFHEAVQSLWFMYAFQRLMGTWSGIGRIDEMLWPYLEKDLAAGRVTLEEAREILAHFWVKGVEWTGTPGAGGGSGDAQFYQNIILGGVDANGNEVTNPVTYLVLDIIEELHISDFPVAVRINRNTPRELLRRVAEVQRHGGGAVAVYNEEIAIAGLERFGYEPRVARGFTNDGCWETLIPGETAFVYSPFDGLALLQEVLGLHAPDAASPVYETFEDLYAAYLDRLARHVEWHRSLAEHHMRGGHPAPLVSMFVDDCIERGRSYYDRGARYTVMASHIGGVANVANSLQVIDRLVYQDHYLPLAELVTILRDDWRGHEPLRRLVQNRFTFYGNDDDAADAYAERLVSDWGGLLALERERHGVLMPAGISTFGREIGWAAPEGGRKASADGHRADEVLATNCSPSPGTDRQGPTAVIKSYCKCDFTKTPNGATLELKVHPETVKGEAGVEALAAMMRGFVRLGGWFMHIDVVDSAMLLDAQRHPEKYPNLPVRIAGWSARFATLNKHWQDMVIARTQQMV